MTEIIYLLAIFGGYAVGRISHIVAHGRKIQSVHHWVHGLVLFVAGLLLHNRWYGLCVAMFGLGLVISDLNDMMAGRFYGLKDHEFEKQKFWGIK